MNVSSGLDQLTGFDGVGFHRFKLLGAKLAVSLKLVLAEVFFFLPVSWQN